MRRRRALLAALLLALLAGCRTAPPPPEETPSAPSVAQPAPASQSPGQAAPSGDPATDRAWEAQSLGDGWYRLDPDLVELLDGPGVELETQLMTRIEGQRAPDDYQVAGSAVYAGRWRRISSSRYPRLSAGDLPYDGVARIDEGYRERAALDEQALETFLATAFAGDRVLDAATELLHYHWSDYRLHVAGPYLSVQFYDESYTGGAHPVYGSRAELFDLRTGDRLEARQVFRDGAETDRLLAACLERYADPDDYYDSLAVPVSDSLNFFLAGDGVHLLFNPYENGPFSAGLREITVPYADLDDILLLDRELIG